MIKQEWKNLFRNPILILVLVVIMLIPSMYAGLFLSSMWDPYGELDKLPVAVVNLDQAVDFNGHTLNIGETLVNNLRDNGSLDFHFVSQKEAEDGLEAGTYYMIITIPEDFSYKASTAINYEPETMQLLYTTNPASNYVATKLSQSAMNKIELSLQESVSKSYIEALIDNINDAGSGLGDAADGANQILDGQNQVIDGVAALSDGTSALRTGASALNQGASDLNAGAIRLSDGAAQLSEGAGSLYSGTGTLSAGTSNLYDGTVAFRVGLQSYLNGTSEVSNGINSLSERVPALVSGISSVNDGAGQLVAGTNQLVAGYEGTSGALSGAQSLSAGAATLNAMVQGAGTSPLIALSNEQLAQISSVASNSASEAITADNQIVLLVAAGLKAQYAQNGVQLDDQTAVTYALQYVRTLAGQVATSTAEGTATQVVSGINQALPGTLGVYTAQLSEGAAALNTGINQLYGGTLQVQSGLTTLYAGTSSLNTGAQTLQSGVNQLSAGATTLITNNNALASGVNSIVAGAYTLNEGATALNTGAATLNSGAAELSDGAASLADGTTTLSSGTSDLLDGARELDEGVGTLGDALPELTDGTTELRDALNDGAVTIADSNLGEQNASMMSNPVDTVEEQITTVPNNGSAMAAYMMSVGLWVACLAFCLMYPLTEHENLKNGFAWWISKGSVLFPIAVLQGVALVFVLKKFLGFEPVNLGATIGVAILSSLAFMTIMYYFNALIGKVGSFLMLVFMVFQLAGSAGTYPIELSGPLAQALHKYVPFTYTVNAFRSTIGGGQSYTSSIVVLVSIIVVFSVLTLWLFQIRSLAEKHGRKNVHDYLESKGLA